MKQVPSFLILATIALLGACDLSPDQKLDEARVSIANHDYSGAKVYLVSALKDAPAEADIVTLLAETQIAMGDGDGALVSLRQVTGKAQSNARYKSLVAEAELLRGNFTEALASLGAPTNANGARIAALAHLGQEDVAAALTQIEAGKALPGDQADLLSVLARIQIGKGDLEDAKNTAHAALGFDPQNIDALLVSAAVAHADYDLPAALKAYQTASELYPQNLPASLGLVGALADMGRIDDARKAMTNLAKLAPKSIEVIHLQAKLDIAEGNWDRARTLLQGHERAMRDSPSMQATYATALLRAGQPSQASALLQDLVETFPAMRRPRALLAEAQLQAGEPAIALTTIRTLAERPDAQEQELTIAAKAARAAGDSAAERYAKRAVTATPQWIGGELAKADAALRNRQWDLAATSYEEIAARSVAPNAMVLNNLAYAKSQSGNNAEATKIALQAVGIAPDHPAILDTAGWLLVETGEDPERGIALLAKASRLDPDNTRIARRLRIARTR